VHANLPCEFFLSASRAVYYTKTVARAPAAPGIASTVCSFGFVIYRIIVHIDIMIYSFSFIRSYISRLLTNIYVECTSLRVLICRSYQIGTACAGSNPAVRDRVICPQADVPEWLRGLTRMSDFVDDGHFISFKHFIVRTGFPVTLSPAYGTSEVHWVCFSLLHSKQDLR